MAAIYSAHGDVGKIVVAPTSTEECFYVTAEAFNLAEQYQCPVIVLADLQQGLNKQSVPALDLSRVKIERGNLQTKDLPELTRPDYFARFADTESGISPRTIPGTPNGMFLSTGLEHDTVGKPAEALKSTASVCDSWSRSRPKPCARMSKKRKKCSYSNKMRRGNLLSS